MNLTIPAVEERLPDRSPQLVHEHRSHAHAGAPKPPMSPVPQAVPAPRIGPWYDGRWKVETFFKRLQSAGQPGDGRVLLKRLGVSGRACVRAGRLAPSRASPGAAAGGRVGVRSGRPLSSGRPGRREGLLAGTWVPRALAAVLGRVPSSRLREGAELVLWWLRRVHPGTLAA